MERVRFMLQPAPSWAHGCKSAGIEPPTAGVGGEGVIARSRILSAKLNAAQLALISNVGAERGRDRPNPTAIRTNDAQDQQSVDWPRRYPATKYRSLHLIPPIYWSDLSL